MTKTYLFDTGIPYKQATDASLLLEHLKEALNQLDSHSFKNAVLPNPSDSNTYLLSVTTNDPKKQHALENLSNPPVASWHKEAFSLACSTAFQAYHESNPHSSLDNSATAPHIKKTLHRAISGS